MNFTYFDLFYIILYQTKRNYQMTQNLQWFLPLPKRNFVNMEVTHTIQPTQLWSHTLHISRWNIKTNMVNFMCVLPSWVPCYRAIMPSWVINIFSWVFFVGPTFFLLGISWVWNFFWWVQYFFSSVFRRSEMLLLLI